jgi:peptidoglycan L-alanyl-D-glutamate endopeptidase CwlK
MTTKSFCPAVYRPLLDRCVALVDACSRRGAIYWATSGLRDHAEQARLYALGRSLPNVDASAARPLGGTVTRARPGESYHNFGLAVDFALDDSTREGLQPTWRPEAYAILGEEAARVGLEWGGKWTSFRDYPHVQWPAVTIGDLQREYARHGIPGVWTWLADR